MKKQFITIGIIILIMINVCSCKKEITTTGVSIDQKSILLNVDNKDTLKVTISPSNATNKNIIWSSRNTSIATVNSSGMVTAVAPGKTLITASTADGDKSDTCVVTSIKWTVYNNTNIGLPYNSIHSIVADSNDNIWVAGSSIAKYDGIGGWTNYLSNQGVFHISIDSNGNEWFGTNGYGVVKFDGVNWTTYTSSNSGLIDNSVTAMATDAQGSIWIGTSSRITWSGTGVSKFDGTTWSSYTTNNGLPFDNVTSIAIDKQGNKWFVSGNNNGNCVSKFDGSIWTTYTASNTNNDFITSIDCMAIDADGNKWFGIANSGVVLKFDGVNWITYPSSVTGLSSIITISIDSKGNIWFGTALGLSKFDGKTWTKYINNNGLNYYYVTSITFDSKGNKWIGTTDGVFELQDQ